MNSDENVLYRKSHRKKCNEIQFIELIEKQSVSAHIFARNEHMPNPGIESCVPSDCTAELSFPRSVHIPNGFVQTARIHSGYGLNVALESWLESVNNNSGR